MATQQLRTGNARKKLEDLTPGPWVRWKTKDRAERCIRFIETYCRPPKGYRYGQTMKLAPFQKEWIREIMEGDITAAALSLPRGQGKSTLLAAIAVWATFDVSESGGPQVPIIATTYQQACRSVYNVAVKMIGNEDELFGRCIIYTGIGSTRFEVPSTGGECFPMANSVDGLQGLDPSLAIADEIGFQPVEAWDSLLLASGKRSWSLVVGIGTPGLDRDNALWKLRSAYMEGKDLPGFIYKEFSAPEGCDHTDEKIWRQANPALVEGYQNINGLRTALELSPESHFRIFHLGQWVEGTDAWLGQDGRAIWDRLKDSYQMVLGAPTWIGLDVAMTRDSTALVMAQRKPDGKLHFSCKIWFPGNDEPVDPTMIQQYIREMDRQFQLVEVAYDPRFFMIHADQLADEGLPMVEYPQSLERMTPACGKLMEVIKRGQISQDGSMEFATQVLNAVPRYNNNGFTLQKNRPEGHQATKRSRGRIDAAIAMAMCHDRAQHLPKPRRPLISF